MLLRTQTLLAAGTIGLAVWAAGADARAQFQAPPNSLALEETGTLEGIQGNIVKFRDSKKEPWLLQVVKQTALSVEGEADADYLRPGMTVELTGEIDKTNACTEPIKELDVLSVRGRPSLGLFYTDDDADAKPLRNPEPGKYRIRGKLALVKDGKLLIAAGRIKITGTLAEELKVKLNLDDARLAQFGDTVKVKAWYFDQGKPNSTFNQPGKALAEEVNISLSNPPPKGKRR